MAGFTLTGSGFTLTGFIANSFKTVSNASVTVATTKRLAPDINIKVTVLEELSPLLTQ